MKLLRTGLPAAIVALLLLSVSLASIVSAESRTDVLKGVTLEQGIADDFEGGSFVAINLSDKTTLAWFGVVYGTEDSPAPITLVGIYIRYLGGAEIRDVSGGMMVPAVPIPVVTVFAQSLFHLIEFNDTGYPIGNERVGADNGMFDFLGRRSLSAFHPMSFEPIYKTLDLTTSWDLSEILEIEDPANGSNNFEFSLSAQNLTYSKIWDEGPAENSDGSRSGTMEDGFVENVEFRFHVEVNVDDITADVPWYRVTIDDRNYIVSSEEVESRTYSGTHVSASFKYDHIIDGWDYTSRSNTSRLMLENLLFFGTFVPDVVQEWIDAQFIDEVDGGSGVMEYQTAEGEMTAETSDDVPEESILLSNNKIVFRDNWEQCGALSWVSNVTVDGDEKEMYHQIHASSAEDMRGDNDDGNVKAIAILGGYIYPAGENIYHDPTFEATSLMLDISTEFQPLIVLLIMGATIACVISVGALIFARRKTRRMDERFSYESSRTQKEIETPSLPFYLPISVILSRGILAFSMIVGSSSIVGDILSKESTMA